MYCPNCGESVSNKVEYCPNCGAALNSPDALEALNVLYGDDETASTGVLTSVPEIEPDVEPTVVVGASEPEPAAVAASEPADAAFEEPAAPRKRHKKAPIIIAIVIVVLVIAGVAAFVAYTVYQNDLKQQEELAASQAAAYAKEHESTAVQIKAQLDGYDFNGGSGFPVNVTGTDLDGNAVSGYVVVDSDDYACNLKRGSYVLEPVGDAISADGTFYSVTTASYNVVVNAMGVEVGTSAFPIVRPQFTKVDADQVTNEQLTGVSTWMKAAGISDAEIDRVIEAATQKRQERIDTLALEEAQRIATRKAAIMEAATDFVNCVYDNSTSDLSTSRNRAHDLTYHYSPQVLPVSVDWKSTSLTSLNSMITVDENTVAVSLSYRYGTKDDIKVYRATLTLAFDSNCKILSGAPGLAGYTDPVAIS